MTNRDQTDNTSNRNSAMDKDQQRSMNAPGGRSGNDSSNGKGREQADTSKGASSRNEGNTSGSSNATKDNSRETRK